VFSPSSSPVLPVVAPETGNLTGMSLLATGIGLNGLGNIKPRSCPAERRVYAAVGLGDYARWVGGLLCRPLVGRCGWVGGRGMATVRFVGACGPD